MQFNLWSACRCPEPNAPHILVGTLHDSHCHQYINVCMNYCKLLWTKVSNKWQKCKDDIMMLLFQRPSDPFISVSLLWAHTDVVHGYFCERCEYSLCIWSEHMHICSAIITKISSVLESSEGKSLFAPNTFPNHSLGVSSLCVSLQPGFGYHLHHWALLCIC